MVLLLVLYETREAGVACLPIYLSVEVQLQAMNVYIQMPLRPHTEQQAVCSGVVAHFIPSKGHGQRPPARIYTHGDIDCVSH